MDTVEPPSHRNPVSKTFVLQQTEQKTRICEPIWIKSFVVVSWSHSGGWMCTGDDRYWSHWSVVYNDILYVCCIKMFMSMFFSVSVLISFYFPLLDCLPFLLFPLLPIVSQNLLFVIRFLFTFCIILFASASAEPGAPSLVYPSFLPYSGLGCLHPRRC